MIQIQDGKVFNSQFQDIYFSQEDGAAESDYVFLKGNDLEGRFADLSLHETFVIGELGFGTGLNFVLARRLFLERAPAEARLQYYSFEIDLPSSSLCRRSLSLFPDLRSDASLLRKKLRGVLQKNTGVHTLFFDNRVRLTLILGDAREEIQKMIMSCDAWFLDGFAPARNPEMWQSDLFFEIAARSKPDASFSSFTAAGGVRSALMEAGFSVERVPGFGRKKHMIRGSLTGQSSSRESMESSRGKQGLVATRASSSNKASPGPFRASVSFLPAGTVNIIGGGLAGLATAHALIQRNIPVQLFEASTVASGASGNLAGMAAASITAEPTSGSLIGLRAQSMFISWLSEQEGFWKKPGMVRKREDWERYLRGTESHRLTNTFHSHSRKETMIGFSAAVEPATLCQYYLERCQMSGIFRLYQGQEVSPDDLQKTGEESIWVLCNAIGIQDFYQARFIPQKPVRGQVLHLPLGRSPYRFPVTNQLYMVPVPSNPELWVLGATFDMHLSDTHRLPQRDEYLLSEMQERLPDFARSLPADTIRQIENRELQGRVGFRSQSRDYLPVCGAVPVAKQFLKKYDNHYTLPGEQKKAIDYAKINRQVQRHPGLYINACHGSRGITTSFLCAEIIAAQIAKEGWPLESSLVDAMDPVRFLWKTVKQSPSNRPDWARETN